MFIAGSFDLGTNADCILSHCRDKPDVSECYCFIYFFNQWENGCRSKNPIPHRIFKSDKVLQFIRMDVTGHEPNKISLLLH